MLISDNDKQNPADYALGFPEFVKLIGVVSASAWLKLKEMSSCKLPLAVDKFIDRITSKQGITTKPFYN